MEEQFKYDYKKCRRLMEKIQESYLEYGKNRIFLTGDELGDLFLRDIREGYYDLKESIKDYVLFNKNFKWFLSLSGSKNQLEFWERTSLKNGKDKFFPSELNCFAPSEVEDEDNLGGMRKKKRKDDDNKVVEELENSMGEDAESKFIDKVFSELLKDKKKNKGEEVCLFIEDLDWVANFYGETKDNKFIKQIKDLGKLKKHLVIIPLKDKSIFENTYYETLDDKELLTISKATSEEIEMTLYRILWKKLKKNLQSINLANIALSFSNSKTSLREVIRIFNQKLIKYGENLRDENFKFKEKVKEKVTWADVELDDEKKKNLIQKIRKFKDGNSERKGILLYGPPGTGKTMIAKTMATEEKLYFMAPKLSELKAEYVGQSAPKVRALFEEARANEPTLIFLDEVDTLFPTRDNDKDADIYTKDMVNEFLQQLDGVDNGEQRIIVVAATNREYMIDPAVKSRLGESVHIPLPSQKEIIKLYNKHFEKDFINPFIETLNAKNRDELIRKSFGMSGRDIKNICSTIKEYEKYKEFLELEKDEKNILFKEIIEHAFCDVKSKIKSTLRAKGLVFCEKDDITETKLYGKDIVKIKREMNDYIDVLTENSQERTRRKVTFKMEKENGILLYGPPGNGKTEVVKSVCRERDLIYIGAEGRSFSSADPIECIDKIETIFSETKKVSNLCSDEQAVVLFFDEFDSLVGPGMNNLIRGTVLTKLSDNKEFGIRNDDSKVLLVAATNFYEQIDEAVKRPGRFDTTKILRNPRREDALVILANSFKENFIKVADKKVLENFYDKIRDIDAIKNERGMKAIAMNSIDENYEIPEDYFEEFMNSFEEGKISYKKLSDYYRCSSSSLINYVKKLKKFLYNNGELEVGKEYILTNEIIDKFGEYING